MIRIKNVTKSYDENKNNTTYALKNISLSVSKGECVVLKGVSGSGKSTLLSIIGAILKPTSGAVEINGTNIVTLSDYHLSNYRANSIGFITQAFNLFDLLTVEQNLLSALLTQKISETKMNKRISSALKLANISHKATQKVYTLSGGEKQRCIIARAIVNEPDIVLCDEPTANLDKKNALIFVQIIKKLKELNKTIIIATHDRIFDELDFVDKSFNISDGKIE